MHLKVDAILQIFVIFSENIFSHQRCFWFSFLLFMCFLESLYYLEQWESLTRRGKLYF